MPEPAGWHWGLYSTALAQKRGRLRVQCTPHVSCAKRADAQLRKVANASTPPKLGPFRQVVQGDNCRTLHFNRFKDWPDLPSMRHRGRSNGR